MIYNQESMSTIKNRILEHYDYLLIVDIYEYFWLDKKKLGSELIYLVDKKAWIVENCQ